MESNLTHTHPELCLEWDQEKNKPLRPEDITGGMHRKIWWRCRKNSDHSWEAMILNRTRGTRCPHCCNRAVNTSNSLSATHPELTQQWHVELNTVEPTGITAGHNKKAWWQCPVASDHVWQAPVVARTRRGDGCPFCRGLFASSTNNLAVRCPEIAAEFDEEANGHSPTSVPFGSAKKVWWKCRAKPEHRWQATVNNRTSKGHLCPYCAGKRADASTCLLAKHPDIAAEWDDANDVGPDTVLPQSHKKVWWKCKKNPNHRWESTINNRVSLYSACPHCNISAGEIIVKKTLEELGVPFSQQYRIPDCKNKRALPFDFAIHGAKLGLVEFQGCQHYVAVKLFGGQEALCHRKTLDQIKRDYCATHQIPLLEIHYNKIGKVPKLIREFVGRLSQSSN